MNRVLWAWVLKKAWKIDMNVLQKKEFEEISEMGQNGKTEEPV